MIPLQEAKFSYDREPVSVRNLHQSITYGGIVTDALNQFAYFFFCRHETFSHVVAETQSRL